MKWKKRLGKRATYNNLISVFEAAGRKDYADNIRRMFGDDSNDSSGDAQPPPYPDPDPLDQSLSQAYCATSPELSKMYDSLDSDTAKTLPEGELRFSYKLSQ